MRELTIHKIDCFETEDAGADELRLELFVDHQHTQSLKREMREGNVWRLQQRFAFEKQVVVRLIEEDAPDADDFLGSITIGPTLRRRHTRSFKEDGALYKIEYSVAEAADNAEPYRVALQQFRESQRPGLWAQITNKSVLLKAVQRTISNPFSVSQERTFLCGPAAIAFELARKKPLSYVALCRALFEEGRFAARTEEIRVSATTMASRIPRGYRPDHWLVLASLRDAANALFPVTGSTVLAGHPNLGKYFQAGLTSLTWPGEMVGWTRELLAYREAEFISCLTGGEMDAFRQAALAVGRGGVAFLLVDAAMVGEDPDGVPNHWIALTGGQNATASTITFECYTFGERRRVALPIAQFEEHLFGVVTGRSPG